MSMPEARDRRILIFLCGIYALLILYSSLLPYDFQWGQENASGRLDSALDYWPVGTIQPSRTDMISNVLAYLPLGFLAVTAGALGGRRRPGIAMLAVLPAALAVSLTVEALQLLSPSRVPSIADVAMNVGGAAIGGALAALFGRRLWLGLAGGARRWRGDRPVALVAVTLMVLLAADAVYPFRPTLDISTVWGNVKASTLSLSTGLDLHPWHHWLVRRVAVYAALSALLAGAQAGSRRPQRLAGAVAATAFAAGIEVLKLLVVSRSFNLANVAAAGCGALVGLALGAMLAGLPVRGQIGLAKRAILAYLIYAAWQPFVLSFGGRSIAGNIPRGPEWLPLYHYAAGGRPADVQNFLGSLVLAAALAFVGRLAEQHDERSGLWSTPVSAAVTAGAIGLVLELGQFAVVTREPTITDVLCFAVGGGMGAWLAGHLRNPLPQSTDHATIS